MVRISPVRLALGYCALEPEARGSRREISVDCGKQPVGFEWSSVRQVRPGRAPSGCRVGCRLSVSDTGEVDGSVVVDLFNRDFCMILFKVMTTILTATT